MSLKASKGYWHVWKNFGKKVPWHPCFKRNKQLTTNGSIIKEATKAEPDPNSNANTTSCMLLKYNAQGTTRHVLLK